MTMIKLGYNPKNKKYKWDKLQKGTKVYSLKEINGYKIVTVNLLLWKKIKKIIDIRSKGFDAVILIDGKRRSGKSTLAKTIAYLLNPDLSIDNYVAGLNEAPEKIDSAKREDVLIFDEGSLVASSKDGMTKKNKQLEKIIDVVGQKRLCLIFCMPDFFSISKPIAVSHSLFLIRVYLDENLNRGFFVYIGQKNKKMVYEYGKRHYGNFDSKYVEWDGKFDDFTLPFEKEYMKLKLQSLREALNPDGIKKDQPLTEFEIESKIVQKIRKNAPDINVTKLAKALGTSTRSIYRRMVKKAELSPSRE